MIVVEGKINGKARPRHTRAGITFTPQNTLHYENWVRLCYKDQCGKYFEGPIRASITAYYKVPKSFTKKRIEAIRNCLDYPVKKPDSDNIAKIILDSLNKIAYNDDAQIIDLKVFKRWTEENERVEFNLEEIQ